MQFFGYESKLANFYLAKRASILNLKGLSELLFVLYELCLRTKLHLYIVLDRNCTPPESSSIIFQSYRSLLRSYISRTGISPSCFTVVSGSSTVVV